MYERSAIVLERYFENLLDYRESCNIRDNFENYCKLVEKLEKYQVNYEKEVEATKEFQESINKIKSIQDAQNKLYQKSAKLEYNRNLLFGNIEGKVEETEKCIEKIENEIEKNNEAMVEEREKLIVALNEYNEKRIELSKCKRYKKMAENDYGEILEISQTNFEGISAETTKNVKNFSNFEDIDDIITILDENGKDEKIPFNEGVISNATTFGVSMAKLEAAGYLTIYEKMCRLLEDIKDGTVKIELHKKYLKNEKAKMDFIKAVKEYIIQFLDYERMTIIYGRKSHNRLMSEACESFENDTKQINNLYELLLMEIANKATKKAYKSLYNKSYLIDIQDQEEKFKKEKSRVNLNTATLINSNFWRIDGIKAIYTVFYKNVFEVFGREVEEFDLPKEVNEDEEELYDGDMAFEVEEEEEEAKVTSVPFAMAINDKVKETEEAEKTEEIEETVVETEKVEEPAEESVKFDEKIDEETDDEEDDDNNEFEDEFEEDFDDSAKEKIFDIDEDFDIFGEKYKENDFIENSIINEKRRLKNIENEEIDTEDFEDEAITEEPLFDIKSIKSQRGNRANIVEDEDLFEDEDSMLFTKLKKVNNIKKKNSESNI